MNENEERTQFVLNANVVAFMYFLSITSFVNAVLLLLFTDPDVEKLLWIFIIFISFLLLGDFLFWLHKSPKKTDYFFHWHGWMALLGSLPIPGISLFRISQGFLMSRKIRSKDIRSATYIVLEQRGRSAFLLTLLLAIIVFELTTITILRVEGDVPDTQISTAGDAIWWAWVTVTTVGYGDLVPITSAGRWIGILAVSLGVALFTVTTSFLTDWFRSGRNRNSRVIYDDSGEPAGAKQALQLIQQLIEQQEAAHKTNMAELRDKLAQVEKMVD